MSAKRFPEGPKPFGEAMRPPAVSVRILVNIT